MRWLFIIGGSLAGLVAVVLIAGYALPVKHVTSRSAELEASPARVWETITDVAAMPQWRSGLRSAEIVGETSAGPIWREISGDGTITYETTESVHQRRLVTRIADKALPFGGSWTYELHPTPTGTRLTIREDGEVYNPIFRFVSRFVVGHEATLGKYLAALESRVAAAQTPLPTR